MIFVKMLQEFILVKTFHNLIKERYIQAGLVAFQSLGLSKS